MSPDHLFKHDDISPDPVELAAADWLVRQDRGLTPAQQRELAGWLQADVRHARMHAKLQEAWDVLAQVPAARFPLQRASSPVLRWLAAPLAAAAAIAIGFFVFHPANNPNAGWSQRSEVTEIGGFKTVNLPDGSVVALNTDSAVEVSFTPSERRIRLVRGEANFAVNKDAARPFIVRAGGVDVRAVGTAFNVRLDPKAVEVLVTEGKVRVDDSASGQTLLAVGRSRLDIGVPASTIAEELLIAGQRVVILVSDGTGASIPAPIVAVQQAEIQRQLAWQSRILDFSDEPLVNVIAEFNRYNRHKLVIADARLAARRFGGKFPAHDYEAFVSFLTADFGVAVEQRENKTILRLAR